MIDSANAQDFRYLFKKFDVAQGLPSSEVHYILRDSRDYLWFATDQGIVRYDGNGFERYPMPASGGNFLFEDDKGRIWVSTFSSSIYFIEDGKVYPYRYNNILREKSFNAISELMFDKSGNLFLNIAGSPGNRTCKISATGKFSTVTKDDSLVMYHEVVDCNENYFAVRAASFRDSMWKVSVPRKDMHYNSIFFYGKDSVELGVEEHFTEGRKSAIRRLNDGRTLYYNGNAIILYANGKTSWKTMDSEVLSVQQTRNGEIWVGTLSEGIFILDNNLELITRLLPGMAITSICEDYLGGIWASTLNQGALYCENTSWGKLQFEGEELSVPIGSIEPQQKSLYFASKNNQVFKLENGRLTDYRLPIIDIAGIHYITQQHELLVSGVASNYNFYYFDRIHKNGEDFVISSLASKLYHTSLGDIMILFTQLRLLDYSKMQNHFLAESNVRIRTLLQRSNGEIIVGTQNGLLKLESGKLFNYAPAKGMEESRITDIVEIDSVLCVATRDKGLYLIEGQRISHYDRSSGLIENNIIDLAVSGNKLWIAGSRSLNLVEIKPGKNGDSATCLSRAARELFDFGEINTIALRDSLVYLGTDNGLIRFAAANFSAPLSLPKMYVSDVVINDSSMGASSTYELSARQNRLSVKIDILDFASSKKFQQRYRLDPSDEWENFEGNRLQFLEFPYGNHKVEIQIAANSDSFEDAKVFKFTVVRAKPFWLTGSFYFVSGLISALFIYFALNRRRRARAERVAMQLELKRKATEMELKALRAQMNPHFIFNSMNSIQYFITNRDARQAQYYLNRFAKLVRRILESSRKAFLPIEEEVQIIQLYLEFEKLRFEEKFDYTINVDPMLRGLNLVIPNMLIQPILENAVKHAFPGNERGKINVDWIHTGDSFQCIIEDDGVGRRNTADKSLPGETHESLGMNLIQEKLAALYEMYGYKASVLATDVSQDPDRPGTRVIFSFPLKV